MFFLHWLPLWINDSPVFYCQDKRLGFNLDLSVSTSSLSLILHFSSLGTLKLLSLSARSPMLGRRFISVPQHLSLMSWVSMPLLVCFICYLPRAVDCQLLESRDLCLLTQLFPLRIEQCLERLQRWFSGSRYLQQGRRCGLTAEVILSALHMCTLTYKISQKGAVSASAQLIGRNYIVSILNLTHWDFVFTYSDVQCYLAHRNLTVLLDLGCWSELELYVICVLATVVRMQNHSCLHLV